MRRGQARKHEGKLTWGQYSGAYDERAGVAAYRTIEGREYKPIDEKVAVARIERAGERRLQKRNKRRKQFIQEHNNGAVEAPEGAELAEDRPAEAPAAGPQQIRFDFE